MCLIPTTRARLYMAPEVLQRIPYGPGVDVYAAGLLVYAMLSGDVPFYAEDDQTMIAAILEHTADEIFPKDGTWETKSADVKDLILCCLTPDPKNRITLQEFWDHPWMNSSPAPDASAGTVAVGGV